VEKPLVMIQSAPPGGQNSIGANTICSDLRSEDELEQLNGIGIENRVIPRAIGLQLVSLRSIIFLGTFGDE